jgi:hypothetical protein
MAAHTLCPQCSSANRTGLLFCVVCGERLPREAFTAEAVSAMAFPGPEVRAVETPSRPSPLAWASLLAAVLAWSIFPLLGAAVAVLLALRAQEEAAHAPRDSAVVRVALVLGGAQLVLGLAAGAAMGAVALTALLRTG